MKKQRGGALVALCLWGVSCFAQTVLTESEMEALSRVYSPAVQGDTLLVKGVIDRNLYDVIQLLRPQERAQLKVLDMHSFGGSVSMRWPMLVAQKIREMSLTTRVSKGHVCASTCLFIFGAGVQREVHADSFVMLHAVRLGGRYPIEFQGLCFNEMEDGMEFAPKKKGCKVAMDEWYELTRKLTNEAFDEMEASGVSPQLRADYMAMPDDPNWSDLYSVDESGEKHLRAVNIFRKPDWHLSVEEMVKYNVATKILE